MIEDTPLETLIDSAFDGLVRLLGLETEEDSDEVLTRMTELMKGEDLND